MLRPVLRAVCAAKKWDVLLMAQQPILENGGEWARLENDTHSND